MSLWSFAIGPPGAITRDLNTAYSRRVNFRLDSPSDASVTLDGWDRAASEIVELATDLYVYRETTQSQPRRLLYRGRIGKTVDQLDANSHTVSVPSVDYREVLRRRLLMSGSTQTYTAMDQAEIAWQLVTQAQNKRGGDLGITNGVGKSHGKPRDRTFNLGDPIGDKIQEISEVIDGFEWDITPTDSNGGLGLQLDRWYPQRGSNKGEVLMYLPSGGNIDTLTRTVDSSNFANAVRVIGKQPEGGGAEPAIQERPTPGTGFDPLPLEGRWDKAFTEDITTTPALVERADWRLADSRLVQPSYTVTVKPGWWRGPDHLWLGDTCKLVVQSGRLNVETDLRVQEIACDVTDLDDEDVSITLGYPKPTFAKTMRDIDYRLAKLERR